MKSLLVALALLAHPLLGQGSLQRPGQWVPDGFFISSFLPSQGGVLDPQNHTLLRLPDPKQAQGFHGFAEAPFWFDGAYYFLSVARSQDPERRTLTLRRLRGAAWEVDGSMEVPKSLGTTEIFPCSNGRYLAIAREDLRKDVSPSERVPFFLLRKNDRDEFVVSSSIHPGFDFMAKSPALLELASNSDKAIAGSHAVLIHRETGLYWVFDLDRGRLRHHGRLYDKITDRVIEGGRTFEAVLAFHPLKDGDVLIQARDEDAILNPDIKNPLAEANRVGARPGSDPDLVKNLAKWGRQDMDNAHPFYRWFRLDPATGSLKRLVALPQGAVEVKDPTKPAVWRPLPDGSVKFAVLPAQKP